MENRPVPVGVGVLVGGLVVVGVDVVGVLVGGLVVVGVEVGGLVVVAVLTGGVLDVGVPLQPTTEIHSRDRAAIIATNLNSFITLSSSIILHQSYQQFQYRLL
jgi:hypothetical protein